jgi:hypothetical protein
LGKVDLEIFEDRLLKKYTLYYELSILIGLDSLSYSVADKYRNFLGFRSYDLEEKDPDLGLSEATLASVFQEDNLIRRGFNSVTIGLMNPLVTFIPNRLYHPDSHADYLEELWDIPAGLTYQAEPVPELNAMMVYGFRPEVKKMFEVYFPEARLLHGVRTLLKNFAQQADRITPPTLHLHLLNRQVLITYWEEGEMRFHNRFPFEAATDLIYFTMLVVDQQKLKPETLEVYFSGKLDTDSEIFRTLNRYLPNIHPFAVDDLYEFGPSVTQEIASHRMVDLFCLVSA